MKFNIAAVAFVAMVAPAMAAKTWDVNVVNGTFSPQEINIAPGDTVRWPNNDADHAIVETNPGARSCVAKAGGFNSGTKTKGQEYQHIFPNATVVNYKDGVGANCSKGATGTIYVGPHPSGSPASGSTSTTTSANRAATRTAAPISSPTHGGASTAEKSVLLGVACMLAALVF
ncbi:hypothetical protein CPC16_010382 [Podila verticillata]|nr:hypothetical protein CPC16_010382 [Podila verticillata]